MPAITDPKILEKLVIKNIIDSRKDKKKPPRNPDISESLGGWIFFSAIRDL